MARPAAERRYLIETCGHDGFTTGVWQRGCYRKKHGWSWPYGCLTNDIFQRNIIIPAEVKNISRETEQDTFSFKLFKHLNTFEIIAALQLPMCLPIFYRGELCHVLCYLANMESNCIYISDLEIRFLNVCLGYEHNLLWDIFIDCSIDISIRFIYLFTDYWFRQLLSCKIIILKYPHVIWQQLQS